MAVVNPPEKKLANRTSCPADIGWPVDRVQQFSIQCTEVQFASFFSGGFITAIVVNPLERWQKEHQGTPSLRSLDFFYTPIPPRNRLYNSLTPRFTLIAIKIY